MKVTNLVSTVIVVLTAAACSTQKPASSQVADADQSADQSADAQTLLTCKDSGNLGAFTSFSITADAGEQGPSYATADGKLVVSGGAAHFIGQRDFQCTNQLAEPQFIGPNGAVIYLWSCKSLALDGSGAVATEPDEMVNVTVTEVGGKITANVDAGLGAGNIDCAN